MLIIISWKEKALKADGYNNENEVVNIG